MNTPAARPQPLLHHAFERQVRLAPARVAVRASDGVLTRAELEAEANRLAHRLQAAGIGADDLVGLCLQRGTALVIAMLAVSKAGGAYLPLDPEYPRARLNDILADAGVRMTLVDAASSALVDAAHAPVVIARLRAEALGASIEPVDARTDATHLAYVIYTSGSSGRPKGVEIEHRQITRLFTACAQHFAAVDDDVWAALHSVAFDASVWEIWGALGSGGTLLMVDRALCRDPHALHAHLAGAGVTVLLQTPAALRLLIEAQGQCQPDVGAPQLALRVLLSGGEALNAATMHAWFDHFGDEHPQVFNAYGPTEVAVITTLRRIRRVDLLDRSRSPIGWPLSDLPCEVRDEKGRTVPAGGIGELCIGGAGVARGYRGHAALTAERFVVDAQGRRFYRSGDRVRLGADGFDYLGRTDRQVKLRGYRIELDEIESALLALPSIAQAAVSLWRPSPTADDRLIAHVVAATGSRPELLRQAAAEILPHHMVPSIFVPMAALPMNASGKVDRLALPAPERQAATETTPRPLSDDEQQVAAVWSDVLAVPVADPDADFFALGGSSLSAVRVTTLLAHATGKQLALARWLSTPTVAGLAAALAHASDAASEMPDVEIDHERRSRPFPLTAVQQAYWLGRRDDFALGGVATHTYGELPFDDLDADRFERVWNRLIARHGMLRMVVGADGQQRILDEVPYYRVVRVDARGEAGASLLAQTRGELSHQVLAAEVWPLFEVRLSRHEGSRWLIHVSLDALALDLGSIHILSRELSMLYQDEQASLPALTLSFRDYVLAEQRLCGTPRYARAQAYWRARLADLPGGPDLPLARNPGQVRHPRFERRSFHLPCSAWQALKAGAAMQQVSPTIVLAGVYALVVCRFARTAHFCLNFTLFNRLPLHAQVDALVGDFTSLTLLEVDWRRSDIAFGERLHDLQRRMWQDLDHREFGGPLVQQALTRQRGENLTFPVVVTSGLGVPADAGSSFDLYRSVCQTQTPQVWLDFLVNEDSDGLHVHWDSVEGLFREGVLDAMFERFTALLAVLAADPSWGSTGLLDTVPPATQALLARVTDTAADVAGSQRHLHEPVLARMAQTPTALAVVSAARSLTYAELDRASARLATALAGVSRHDLVAVVMPKHWAQVVAVLGILRAGAAYLPIDADLPPARVAQLLALGEVRHIVSLPAVAERLALDAICVDPAWLAADAPPVPPSPAAGTDLAYVIFTSGSTGTPKGVMIDHRGALNTVLDINARYGITAADAVFALSSLSFDLSVYDVFGVLGAGGRLVVPAAEDGRDPEAWLAQLTAAQVTVWNTVPALLQMLVDYLDGAGDAPALPPLRTILLSGDWIPVDLPARLRRWFGDVAIYSLGGATEASIWSIAYRIGAVDPAWTSVPYGTPLANQQVMALKPDLTPCPVGVVGELHLGGLGLAQGYWRDPARTAAQFVTDPRSGRRWYRTGDLGRLLPDGNLEFLGRDDTQVKIQGYRIELGEIEARLKQHPQVKDAVVIAHAHGAAKQLLAYVVEKTTSEHIDPQRPLRDPRVLTVEAERRAFTLEQHARRRDLNMAATVVLPMPHQPALHIDLDADARVDEATQPLAVMSIAELAELLAVLAGEQFPGLALPKYRYPSAGGLYPIQVYVLVGLGSPSLPTGYYYFDPLGRVLRTLSPPPGNASGIELHLVCADEAIEPLYGELASGFADLEAGYMTALLSARASRLGIRLLTPESDATLPAIPPRHRRLLRLRLAHASTSSFTASAFALSPVARKSYREFERNAIDIDACLSWLPRKPAEPRTWLWLRDDRSSDTAGTCHEVGPDGRLQHAPVPEFDADAVFRHSRSLLATAGFVLMHTGAPAAAIPAGRIGQAFMQRALACRVGTCVSGGFDAELAHRLLALDDGEVVLQVIFGGAVPAASIAAAQAPATKTVGLTPAILAAALSEDLPPYMVPRRIMLLEALPLSANGKIDLKSLPRPIDPNEEGADGDNGSDTARRLTGLLASLLRITRVRTTDNFFEIGGDSLLAVQLTQAARAAFDVVLPIRTVFNRPRVSDLADAIDDLRRATIAHAPAVCAQDEPIPARLQAAPDSLEEVLEL